MKNNKPYKYIINIEPIVDHIQNRGRDGEKVNLTVCVITQDSGNLAVISSSTATSSMRLNKLFIPLCLTSPLDFLALWLI